MMAEAREEHLQRVLIGKVVGMKPTTFLAAPDLATLRLGDHTALQRISHQRFCAHCGVVLLCHLLTARRFPY